MTLKYSFRPYKFTCILGTTLCLLIMFNNSAAETIEVGQPAPNFNLPDQTGKHHSLKDYSGQWLIVYFYPKDDTPGCTKEACAFRDDFKAISAKNTQVLGISIDSKKSHADFAKKYNLPFPLLSDQEGKVAKQFQSLISLGPIKFAKRHTFIIDQDGIIQKIYRKVNPSNHSQQILNDLKNLQIEKK